MADAIIPSYDFDFIIRSIGGLLPVRQSAHDVLALNPAMIVSINREPNGDAVIRMYDGTIHSLTAEDMAAFEQTIRRRIEEQKELNKEAMYDSMLAQAEAAQRITSGTPGGRRIQPPWPTSRRH